MAELELICVKIASGEIRDSLSSQMGVDKRPYHETALNDIANADEYSSGSDRSYDGDDLDAGNSESASDSTSKSEPRKRVQRHGSHGNRRHKGGNRHKKTFLPYPQHDEVKLKRESYERKEKEKAVAVVRRDEGDHEFINFPVAPFNSTQFLMDEHHVPSPGVVQKSSNDSKCSTPHHVLTVVKSVNSTPSSNNHEIMNSHKKDDEFADFYSTVHAESLQSLHKEELVKHYMSLEEKVELLQRELAVVKRKKLESGREEGDVSDSATGSDTNSLSSINEDFVDLSSVNQPTISIGDNQPAF